jgi:hypothetical protein
MALSKLNRKIMSSRGYFKSGTKKKVTEQEDNDSKVGQKKVTHQLG